MKNLLDTEGTVLFPFQTEIHFIWTIFSTVKRLVIGTTAAWRLQIVVWQNMSFQSNHPE
ncbi:hypothetical protein [Escherichia coli]|uniref:hypothetical protein n=1 Tax=Escherichia coli TaxID=562 RepID=UPI003974B03D